QWNPTPTRNMLCVPILSLSNKKVTGVIQVVNKVHGDGFTEEDIALMEKTAYHLELAIENLFLSRDMVRISDKMQEKVSYADFMLKAWVGFLVLVVVSVVVYFTPIILEIFLR
ncbi:GAF domain-containing protein, partial [Magnetococcales bacterium HHB-1]